jgi:hypothetical protein
MDDHRPFAPMLDRNSTSEFIPFVKMAGAFPLIEISEVMMNIIENGYDSPMVACI